MATANDLRRIALSLAGTTEAPDFDRGVDTSVPNLEPYQFDRVVEDAAARLGEKINARAFRDRHLPTWRTFLASLPDYADPIIELERLIDGQVADHFRSQLPIRTQEIMDALELEPGPDVKRAVEIVKRLFNSGVRNRDDLIARARAEFEKMPPRPDG
jgi:hypothetical protein